MKNALPSVNEVLDKIFLYFGAVEGYILSSLASTPPDSTEQADVYMRLYFKLVHRAQFSITGFMLSVISW